MSEKITFHELLQKISDLKPDSDGLAYIAEIPLRVAVSVWITTDEQGKIDHFTPHLNFYTGGGEDEDQPPIFAEVSTQDYEVKTPAQVAAFLKAFADQATIQQDDPVWEEDEAY